MSLAALSGGPLLEADDASTVSPPLPAGGPAASFAAPGGLHGQPIDAASTRSSGEAPGCVGSGASICSTLSIGLTGCDGSNRYRPTRPKLTEVEAASAPMSGIRMNGSLRDWNTESAGNTRSAERVWKRL